jgi:uncharacterized membrane protein
MPHAPSIRREFDLRRFAAAVSVIASVLGVAVGAHLTLLKFKMTYTPCLTTAGGCQFGGLTCGAALGSPASMLLGLPISLWGSAFYLMIAVLAISLFVRRDAFNGVAAHVLLVFAGLGVFISGSLAAYTVFVLPSPCPFCLSLYAISALLLGTSLAILRPPGGTRAPGLREVLRSRLADVVHCLFVALLVFVSAAGIQSMAYHGARGRVDAQTGCPAPRDPLPRAAIKVGAKDPAAILAVFIDMTCSDCRKEFRLLAKALGDGKFREPVQLWIYHTPRHACDTNAFLDGYRRTDDAARTDNACLAARTAECTEKLQEGMGYPMIAGLFALQDDREPDAPLFTAERVGDRAVDVGLDIDPDDAKNPLFVCINADTAVLDRITAHQKFAELNEFKVPTVAVYRAVGGAADPSRRPLFADANTPISALIAYVSQQAAAEVTP